MGRRIPERTIQPTAMKFTGPNIAIAALGSVMFLSLPTSVSAGPPAQRTVLLTGWLHVEDYTMEDVVLRIRVGTTTRTASVAESGRFTVELPADTKAVLRFEKPGHLAKEVVVDTRHAGAGDFNQRSRHVKFAVIMQLERHMAGLTYPGPVGTLAFDEGGGCLAVSHDRNLVPAKQRNAPMVF